MNAMKRAITIAAALLIGLAAAAQTGTNSGSSQELQKPRTGRNDQVITSPDINAAITGTEGTTTGQPPDVLSATAAVAGATSAGALTTADVTTRTTMEKQRLMGLLGKPQPPSTPQPPSPPFIASSSGGMALNGHNEAETSRRAGLVQGPSTDNGASWDNMQAQQPQQAQAAQQPTRQKQQKKKP
jgi:hypothetical protein